MVPKTLQTLERVYKVLGLDITPLVLAWSKSYRHAFKHNGKKYSVNLMKEYLTLGERYSIHQKLTPIPFRKSDKNGFPSQIKVFKPWLRSENVHKVRAALSVLRTVEDLRLPISKDIGTVIEPPSHGDLSPILDFIPQWCKRFKRRIYLEEMKYHLTSKNGPNGPALLTTDKDLGAIITSELWLPLQEASSVQIDETPPDHTFVRNDGGIHSRLAQFPEKSGKTRTIAIIDYWSQRALRPLHNALMDILKSLESDGTYSHRNIGKYAKQSTKEKSFIACFDLTAATDRFPSQIQKVLLGNLLPEKKAAPLWSLLAERTFTVSWSGEKVNYGVGQPMGALSSWPLFAIAHHLVIEYCSKRQRGVKYKYKMIGDDVIITDEAMARKYLETMTLLGVKVNLDKTVTVSAESNHSAARVAKQLYHNGIQLTPITPGFLKTFSNPLLINQVMEELNFREIITNPQALPLLLRTLFPKEKSLLKAVVLIQNPMNGFAPHINMGNAIPNRWTPYTKEYVHKVLTLIRLRNLCKQVESYDVVAFEQTLEPIPLEGSAETEHTPTHEALLFTKRDLETAFIKAAFRLSCAEIEDLSTLDLMPVEFITDPGDPFGDLKRRRELKKSSLLLETLEVLENSDITLFEDEVETLKQGMIMVMEE